MVLSWIIVADYIRKYHVPVSGFIEDYHIRYNISYIKLRKLNCSGFTRRLYSICNKKWPLAPKFHKLMDLMKLKPSNKRTAKSIAVKMSNNKFPAWISDLWCTYLNTRHGWWIEYFRCNI